MAGNPIVTYLRASLKIGSDIRVAYFQTKIILFSLTFTHRFLWITCNLYILKLRIIETVTKNHAEKGKSFAVEKILKVQTAF